MLMSKTNSSIDCAKLFLSLYVVTIHTGIVSLISNKDIYNFCYLTIATAVPFFFVTSSFLFWSKNKNVESSKELKSAVLRYMIRIWILYTIWFLLYIPIFWVHDGRSVQEQIQYLILKYFVIVGNGHLWYLWASLVGVPFVALLHCKNIRPLFVLLIGVLLFILSRIYYHFAPNPHSFLHLIYQSDYVFVYGICASIAYSSIGYYIASKGVQTGKRLLLCVFVLGYIIGFVDRQPLVSIGLLLISYALFQLVSTVNIKLSDTISKRIRCMSTFIYCSHLYILHNVYSETNPCTTYILTLCLCLFAAYIFSILKERINFLKYLV